MFKSCWHFLLCLVLSQALIIKTVIAETNCVCGNGIQEILPQNVAPCPFKLYGATALGPTASSNLLYLNPYDGTGAVIGTITNMVSVNGLDFSPTGVLYASGRNNSNQPVLATVDCETAQATIIGVINAPNPSLTDINFDAQGRLWTHVTANVNQIRQDGLLGLINITTASFTPVGFTFRNDMGNAIGFANFPNSILYHAGSFELDILDQMTGQATSVEPLIFSEPAHNRPRLNSMDIDPYSNVMYVSINDKPPGQNSPNLEYLGQIDLSSGVVSYVKIPANLAPTGLSAVTVNRPYETCDQGSIPVNDPPLPTGCLCSELCGLIENDCTDAIDNDFDGIIDCEDIDCDNQPCTPLDICAEGAVCSSGSCQGTPMDCDDFNDCTDDSCNQGFCINDINTSNACTDFNSCTNDICDESGFCASQNLPDGEPCDDESDCTVNDICIEGQCLGDRIPEDCENGLDDDCDGFTDGDDSDCGSPVTIEDICDDNEDNDGDTLTDCLDPDCDGLVCMDEGNPCTDDICSLSFCDHFSNDLNTCSDGNPCTDDACSFGDCIGTNNDSNPCDDDNDCTMEDFCQLGICQGNPVVCNDDNVCTNDICITGACSFIPLDGNPCASDNNACTDDLCNAGICEHINNNTNICTDDLACTSGDHCSAGLCTGTPGVENCSNGIDDDCDFLIDTFDPNCSSQWLRVFVTKNTYDPDFGSAAAADALCQASAVAASRSGIFKAFVSSSISDAATRILNPHNRPWYLYTSTPARIADDKTDLLDGTIQQAINADEFGVYIGNPKFVWTGSDADGTATENTCDDWTTTKANIKGTRGASDKVTSFWANQPDATCNQEYRLYCFQIDTSL